MSSVVSALFQQEDRGIQRRVLSPGGRGVTSQSQSAQYQTGRRFVRARDGDRAGTVRGAHRARRAVFLAGAGVLVGTAHLISTSSSADYDFTWDERDPQLGLYGGFAHGPTYQLAILHLILCYLDLHHGGSERSAEIMQAWFKLVETMKRFYPGGFDPERGWRKADVASACSQSEVRQRLEHAADAMWFTLRYFSRM